MSGRARAKRVATYEWGTYIVAPSPTRPYRVITMDPSSGKQVERRAHTEAEGLTTDALRTLERLAEETVKGLIDGASERSCVLKVADVLRLHVTSLIGDLSVDEWTPEQTEYVLNTARSKVERERLSDIRASMRAMIRRDSLPVLSECIRVEAAVEKALGERWRIGVEPIREMTVRWGEFLALTPENFSFVGADGRHPDRSWWVRKWRKAVQIADCAGRGWTIHTWRSVRLSMAGERASCTGGGE
jgi:hypothetical protein